VTLRLQREPDADWPFAFEAQQRISLQADTLRWELSLKNTDPRVQPAGVGWHPYLLHQPGQRLQAAVSGRWDRGEDALPRARHACAPLDADPSTLQLDHCFDGWSGEAWVSDAQQRLHLHASTRHLVVFTPPGAAHFCVEPVSHVNNAVQSADPLAQGLVALAPGETLSAWFELSRLEAS
jgi:aldose 1-epimerase